MKNAWLLRKIGINTMVLTLSVIEGVRNANNHHYVWTTVFAVTAVAMVVSIGWLWHKMRVNDKAASAP